jgi:hypothetical protein
MSFHESPFTVTKTPHSHTNMRQVENSKNFLGIRNAEQIHE